jgi:HSP20 family protein
MARAERRHARCEASGPKEGTMSIINVRKNGDQPAVPARAETNWDPWRTMRSLLVWDPFREIAPLSTYAETAAALSPPFEVKETKEAYQFKADVPGIDERELEVTITGNRLTVSGKREAEREEKSDRYYAYERNYGTFTRSFTLPDGADLDKLNAHLEKGVLTLTVPKKPEVQPKKIAVKSEGQAIKS